MSPKELVEFVKSEAADETKSEEALVALRALLRRDWSIRVLDHWKSLMHGRNWKTDPVFHTDQLYSCSIQDSHGVTRRYTGMSEDLARQEAAGDLFLTLDRNHPNWPGPL